MAQKPQKIASIKRDRKTKLASLDIREYAPWELFAGPNQAEIDFGAPVLTASKAGIFPIPKVGREHAVFCVKINNARIFIAERQLPMEKGYNFRDLGGYPGADGRFVTWGKLFRADELWDLSLSDLEYLASIPLASVVDLRQPYEIENYPDKLPKSASHIHRIPICGTPITHSILSKLTSRDLERAFMLEGYRGFAHVPEVQEGVRWFFTLLMDDVNIPVMSHCTAGKDRTGLLSALILLALGVSQDIVMDDYMLSNQLIKGKFPFKSLLYSVEEEFLLTTLEEMEKRYGSVENYLRDIVKLDLELFRNRFLSRA